jgi:microcystin-dependent protein
VQQLLGSVGDIKPIAYSVAAGSENAGWLLCDGRAVSRSTYSALWEKLREGHAGTVADPAPHGNGDTTTTFNLPDYRGRMLVGSGQHAEVNAVGKNDGVPVANRKVKHKHGKGNLSISGGSHTHPNNFGAGYHQPASGGGSDLAFPNVVGGVTLAFQNMEGRLGGGVQAASHTHPTNEFNGEVGDPDGPTDGPGFSVVNYLIKT